LNRSGCSRSEKEYIVHVRSKDGAEGVSLTNPPRAEYLQPILNQLVIPFFIGKDARDLDNLLWSCTAGGTTTKMYWTRPVEPASLVEFAILTCSGASRASRLGRCSAMSRERRSRLRGQRPARHHAGTGNRVPAKARGAVRSEGAEVPVGGRMSRNADASPGRTENLIALIGKAFGGKIDIHADSNSFMTAEGDQSWPHA
jgi:hypothetical protein